MTMSSREKIQRERSVFVGCQFFFVKKCPVRAAQITEERVVAVFAELDDAVMP